MSAALVRRTSVQSIPTATTTYLQFEEAVHDAAGLWSINSSSLLAVPDSAKWVQLRANVSWDAAGGSTNTWCEFHKNGAKFNGGGGSIKTNRSTATDQQWFTSAPVEVVSGDTFQVQVWHNKGSNQNVNTANATWFGIEIIE